MLRSILPALAAICRPPLRPAFVPLRAAAPFACAAAAPPLTRIDAWLERTLAAEQRRHAALQKEAESAKKAERLGAWATLVVSNLYRIDSGATSVVVEDWENDGRPTELKFDPAAGSPQEQADAAFQKARKLRRGTAVVAALLEESATRQARLDEWRAAAAAIAASAGEGGADDGAASPLLTEIMRGAKKMKLKVEGLAEGGAEGSGGDGKLSKRKGGKPEPSQAPIAPSKTPGWSGREFESPSGIPILVGRNRKQNEELSLRIAREPDVWMHVRGSPGAHVILQVSRVKGRPEPTEDCLQMAADLAAFYSEMRDERKTDVTLASPRHVTKPKGAPLGAVKLRQEAGTIVGRPATSEFVPKEAREQRDKERFGEAPVTSAGGSKQWS